MPVTHTAHVPVGVAASIWYRTCAPGAKGGRRLVKGAGAQQPRAVAVWMAGHEGVCDGDVRARQPVMHTHTSGKAGGGPAATRAAAGCTRAGGTHVHAVLLGSLRHLLAKLVVADAAHVGGGVGHLQHPAWCAHERALDEREPGRARHGDECHGQRVWGARGSAQQGPRLWTPVP